MKFIVELYFLLCCFLGQIIPKGLHVRLNLQTGEKEAKLMSNEDDSKSHESAGNGLLGYALKDYHVLCTKE